MQKYTHKANLLKVGTFFN